MSNQRLNLKLDCFAHHAEIINGEKYEGLAKTMRMKLAFEITL